MQKIAQRIAKADWEKHKRDRDIEPFLHLKNALSVAEGLIFRENRITLKPSTLKRLINLDTSWGISEEQNETNAEAEVLPPGMVSIDEA